MAKKCATCGKPLPPGKDRVLIEIRKIPGLSWKFWKFFGGLEFGDINQGIFCSEVCGLEYLDKLAAAKSLRSRPK